MNCLSKGQSQYGQSKIGQIVVVEVVVVVTKSLPVSNMDPTEDLSIVTLNLSQ